MVLVLEDFAGQVVDDMFYSFAVPWFADDVSRLQEHGYEIVGIECFDGNDSINPYLDTCMKTRDFWICPQDPDHTGGGWTEFSDSWLWNDPTEPPIDFIPIKGGGGCGQVVGHRLATAMARWGLREILINKFDEPLADSWSDASKQSYYWLKTDGGIRVRPPKVLDGPNSCPNCGWGPVVCPECGYVATGECPVCECFICGTMDMTIDVEAHGEPLIHRDALPGRSVHDDVLLGRTWNCGDIVGGFGPRVVSRRFLRRLREVNARPFAVKSVAVDTEGMTDEQWKMLNDD